MEGGKGNGERRHVHALRWLRKLRWAGIVCCYERERKKQKRPLYAEAGSRGSVVFI